jgi:uncharacterized membrane protein YtjA (UPF0391 family)
MSTSDWAKKLQNIPRPITAAITILIIIIPMIYPLNIPVPVTDEIKDFYEYVQNLPSGAVVLFAFDCETVQWVRTGGGVVATLNLLLREPVRIIIFSITPDAQPIYPILLSLLTIPEGKKYGVDFVYFGYISGGEAALAQLAFNLRSPGKDYLGNKFDTLPIMDNVHDHNDVALLIQNDGGGETTKMYVRQWSSPYKVKMAMLQTPVNTVMNLPFRATGQIQWVIWDNAGGAELETLLGYSGWGTANTNAQNLLHIFIILMVILGNIGYALEKKKRGG